jgi:hypothetical protein
MKTALVVVIFLLAVAIAPSSTGDRLLRAGTSIVAIRTPTELFLGADSQAVWGEDEPPVSVCKVVQISDSFFAAARLVADNRGDFDVARTAAAVRRPTEPLLDSVSRFETAIEPQLIDVASYIREHNRISFNKEVVNKPALEVAFFAWESSTPVLYLRYFNVTLTSGGSLAISMVRKNCPGDCPTGIVFVALGHHEAIDAQLREVPHYWRRGLATSILELIELQAKTTPNFVGGPIDIIRLSASGAEWIQRKRQCHQ